MYLIYIYTTNKHACKGTRDRERSSESNKQSPGVSNFLSFKVVSWSGLELQFHRNPFWTHCGQILLLRFILLTHPQDTRVCSKSPTCCSHSHVRNDDVQNIPHTRQEISRPLSSLSIFLLPLVVVVVWYYALNSRLSYDSVSVVLWRTKLYMWFC